MAADALAPYVARASAAMAVTMHMHDKQVLVLHMEMPALSQCYEMEINIFMFPQNKTK